jgi:signal transduction histidine kinase
MDLLVYITILINPVLGLFVFLKGKRNLVTILIFLLTLLLSAWTISNHFYSKNLDYEVSLLVNKLVFTFTAPLISILAHLAIVFPVESSKANKLTYLVYIPAILFVPLSFSNLIVKDINLQGESVTPVFSYGAIFFAISSITVVVSSLIIFASNYRRTHGIQKIQMQYFAIGLSLTAILATLTNLVLPMGLSIFQLTVLGPSFSLIFISMTIFAIVRYQLFDIRLLLGKIVYYLLSSIPPYAVYFFLAYIYESIFGTSFNMYAYIIGIPVAIAFTAFANNSNRFLSEYTDSHLINPGYNPLVVLEQLRQRLTTSLDIEKISQESLFMIARTIRPESSGVIIMTNNQTNELLSFNYKKEPYTSTQDFMMFLQFFISRNIKTISTNDLKDPQQNTSLDHMLKSHILSQMEKYKLEVILPLKEEQKVRGILLVGYKEAKAPYNSQELKLLVSIAETMSLGIGRALLYKEIQQFNETLQKKVTNATTELQTKNQALEEALLKLEEVRRQEKDMLDVMGHELRTPISIARNSVVTLQKHIEKNDTDPEKLKKYTKMAVESIRREIALIETFLSTTKLEGGRMQVNLEKVSLKEVIYESIEGHIELAKRSNTKVVYDEPENDIFVLADKIRIQEVMDNFLNNAIKYTGDGNVGIKMYEQEGLGWIDVKDDGIGISKENLEKLGRKFFRAQTLYNQSNNVVNPSGTGLGLFVSFQLIDLMKGKRKIVSQEDAGSIFSFGLPLN